MSKKLTHLLGKIVGRIGKYMDAVFMTMGGILVPLGFFLLVARPDIESYGILAVIFGLACWVFAFLLVRQSERLKELQRQADREVTNNLVKRADTLAITLINEIKGLRQDLRGDKDDHTSTDDRK